jgi:hypothetical protein
MELVYFLEIDCNAQDVAVDCVVFLPHIREVLGSHLDP